MGLKHCPFCGDTSPEVASGPCTFTDPKHGLFMAQVTCTHCAAAGPRYCGEDSLEAAIARASEEWNGVKR